MELDFLCITSQQNKMAATKIAEVYRTHPNGPIDASALLPYSVAKTELGNGPFFSHSLTSNPTTVLSFLFNV